MESVSLPDLLEKLLGEDKDAWPPEATLLLAAHHGNLRRVKEIAATLDDDGVGIAATVARTTFHGMNALHAARELPVYRYLVEVANMDVNKPDNTPARKTPLDRAMADGDLSAVRYLIDHGADIHHERQVVQGNITILHSAAKKGRTEIVKLLLSRGAHVDGKSGHGTPLHFAATKGYESTVKILLEHHADPNKAAASCHTTPLAAALFATSLPCVKLLIQAGADVNTTNNPLVLAAESGLTEAIKLLLEAGANPNCPDMHGRMPIELAAVHGTREDVEILFPFTNPIPTVADWSVDGLITYAKLECKKLEDDDYVKTKMSNLKQKGDEAFEKQDYVKASELYTLDDDSVETKMSVLKQKGDEAFEKQDCLNASAQNTGVPKADPKTGCKNRLYSPPCPQTTKNKMLAIFVMTLVLSYQGAGQTCNSKDMASKIFKACDSQGDSSPVAGCCRLIREMGDLGDSGCICLVAHEYILHSNGFSAARLEDLYYECGGSRPNASLSLTCESQGEPDGNGNTDSPPPPVVSTPNTPIIIVRVYNGEHGMEIKAVGLGGMLTLSILIVVAGAVYLFIIIRRRLVASASKAALNKEDLESAANEEILKRQEAERLDNWAKDLKNRESEFEKRKELELTDMEGRKKMEDLKYEDSGQADKNEIVEI